MEVRRLVTADLDAYFALRLEALKTAPDAFLITYEEEVQRGNARFAETLAGIGPEKLIFGGFLDGRLLGSAGVSREAHSKLKHKATLTGMYVGPAARGTGLSRALVNAVIAHARNEMKAIILTLSVSRNNEVARRLYLSAGFRTWGVEPKANLAGDGFLDNEHMTLEL